MSAPTLYQELLAAGVPLDHHESDLYAKVTEESRAIVGRRVGELDGYYGLFRSALDGGAWWYDIPFGFEPWWEARRTRASSNN